MSEFAAYAPGERPNGPRLGDADGLRIRPATDPDLPRLAPIAAAREGVSASQALESLRRFAADAEAERALLLVAELGDEAVGFGKAARFTPASDAAPNTAPAGWYLAGVVVGPRHRRRGVGAALTAARLAWIASRSPRAYYFANARNQVSIDLHRAFGFVELTRDFVHPHATFEGGVGILFVREGAADPRAAGGGL